MGQMAEYIGMAIALLMVLAGVYLLYRSSQSERSQPAQSADLSRPDHQNPADDSQPASVSPTVAETDQATVSDIQAATSQPQPHITSALQSRAPHPQVDDLADDQSVAAPVAAESVPNDQPRPADRQPIGNPAQSLSTQPSSESADVLSEDLNQVLEQIDAIQPLPKDPELVYAIRHDDSAASSRNSAAPVRSSHATVIEQSHQDQSSTGLIDQTLQPQLQTVTVEQIDEDEPENATVLDAHLSKQDRLDEQSALATAEKLIALYLYPNPQRALSGDRALRLLTKYGLRYGEMSCFHRYEDPEQTSPLMFSVLRLDEHNAPIGFDLESLSSEEVRGLAFFLALPNPHAATGYDMMASLSTLMARDLEGAVFDENGLELTQQLREHWRHQVIELNSKS